MKKLKTTRSNEFKQYAVTKEGKLICTNAIKPMDTVVDVEYELLPVKLNSLAWIAGVLLSIALIFVL